MRFVSFCPPLNRLVIECASNSANLYIVILTFEGQHSVFKVDRHAHKNINAHPKGRDAWELYMFLNDKHGHQIGKRFAINVKAIRRAYKFHFGERAMYTAINTLRELGYLKLMKNYSAQRASRLFQLSIPV